MSYINSLRAFRNLHDYCDCEVSIIHLLFDKQRGHAKTPLLQFHREKSPPPRRNRSPHLSRFRFARYSPNRTAIRPSPATFLQFAQPRRRRELCLALGQREEAQSLVFASPRRRRRVSGCEPQPRRKSRLLSRSSSRSICANEPRNVFPSSSSSAALISTSWQRLRRGEFFFFLQVELFYVANTQFQRRNWVLIKMSGDFSAERALLGGAMVSTFPLRFQDVSNIRQVPDHQEVFVDPSRDESLIFELLDFKHDVGDNGSAVWFLQDLVTEQDAEGCMVLEQSGVIEAPGLCYRNIPSVITSAVGQMAISKGRQGREAQNIVRVYLSNLRLKGVGTDMLICAYEPILINPLSESASSVGSGLAVPAPQSGCIPMSEVFKLAVSSFKVKDWSVFGAPA